MTLKKSNFLRQLGNKNTRECTVFNERNQLKAAAGVERWISVVFYSYVQTCIEQNFCYWTGSRSNTFKRTLFCSILSWDLCEGLTCCYWWYNWKKERFHSLHYLISLYNCIFDCQEFKIIMTYYFYYDIIKF